MLSIDTLRCIQDDLGLYDVHIACVGNGGFTIAHTNDERAELDPLTNCALHRWLLGQDGPPANPGLYVVVPEGMKIGHGWKFKPLDVAS